MSDEKRPSDAKGTAREDRLKAALRANLSRRKSQARARKAPAEAAPKEPRPKEPGNE